MLSPQLRADDTFRGRGAEGQWPTKGRAAWVREYSLDLWTFRSRKQNAVEAEVAALCGVMNVGQTARTLCTREEEILIEL